MHPLLPWRLGPYDCQAAAPYPSRYPCGLLILTISLSLTLLVDTDHQSTAFARRVKMCSSIPETLGYMPVFTASESDRF